MGKDDFFGIVVYTIHENGSLLNGLWTNIKIDRVVCNEIATLTKPDKNKKEHCGVYCLSYTDNKGKQHNGKMVISFKEGCYKMEQFIPETNNKSSFTGNGFKFGNQLIFTYWES